MGRRPPPMQAVAPARARDSRRRRRGAGCRRSQTASRAVRSRHRAAPSESSPCCADPERRSQCTRAASARDRDLLRPETPIGLQPGAQRSPRAREASGAPRIPRRIPTRDRSPRRVIRRVQAPPMRPLRRAPRTPRARRLARAIAGCAPATRAPPPVSAGDRRECRHRGAAEPARQPRRPEPTPGAPSVDRPRPGVASASQAGRCRVGSPGSKARFRACGV